MALMRPAPAVEPPVGLGIVRERPLAWWASRRATPRTIGLRELRDAGNRARRFFRIGKTREVICQRVKYVPNLPRIRPGGEILDERTSLKTSVWLELRILSIGYCIGRPLSLNR